MYISKLLFLVCLIQLIVPGIKDLTYSVTPFILSCFASYISSQMIHRSEEGNCFDPQVSNCLLYLLKILTINQHAFWFECLSLNTLHLSCPGY